MGTVVTGSDIIVTGSDSGPSLICSIIHVSAGSSGLRRTHGGCVSIKLYVVEAVISSSTTIPLSPRTLPRYPYFLSVITSLHIQLPSGSQAIVSS